jgi:transcription-repair coupling factor (superfamily II helicase)
MKPQINADQRRSEMTAANIRSVTSAGEPSGTAWFDRIADSSSLRELIESISPGGPVAARGVIGSSANITAAAIAQRSGRTVVLVVAHLDEADEALDELESLGIRAEKFPAIEYAPGESGVNVELLAERLALVQRLMDGDAPAVVIAPIQSLMQHVPRPETMRQVLRVIAPGMTLNAGEFSEWLHEASYRRTSAIENPGEYAMRGGIIDIYPPGGVPARIDLFGDEVDGLFEIDLATMGSDRKLDRIEVIGAAERAIEQHGESLHLADVLPGGSVAVLIEMLELMEQARGYHERVSDSTGIFSPSDVFRKLAKACHATVEVNHLSSATIDDRCVSLPVEPLPGFAENASEAVAELAELPQRCATIVVCQNDGEAARMKELLAEFAPGARVEVERRYVHRGFVWGEVRGSDRSQGEAASEERAQSCQGGDSLAIVPYHELLHRYHTRRRVRRIAGSRTMDAFLDLQPGDYVVHRDHGIARFAALRTLDEKRETAGGQGAEAEEEYLTLEFAGRAKLHVPVSKIDLVQKYIGAFTGKPELSTLGGKKWKRQKEQVREAVRDFAAEMLRLQAAREALPGVRYPADTTWQKEFEAEFPYEETEDQLAAIAAIKRDMNDPKPMDRLICGDVGFGKTEVAMRAAFKAAEYGKQVAVLVPTTVLAEQHDRTFRDRFADYPFRIESLSRFKTKKQQTELLHELKLGKIDIIIGTHRLLSKDVKFADLGLVIIDEEQRFGVEHKQKLLQFRATADVLTLSATPIPRTLHMAMLGLRDISSLTTPPLDRRAIVTEVMSYDRRRIGQAIARELAREGQVFFVHNRVYDIESVADDVRRLAPPEARVIVGHGQMPMRELERVMLKFVRGEADILVSTTIIESGIDIPRVNTMIIHHADIFGLAELHQLRGRVGRYKHRAYCYLTVSEDKVLSEVALKRLRAIESFSMLGAGFKIALRDLEIRGAGSLLGQEQSGHIAAVGYEMYCQLLEQEVRALRHQRIEQSIDVTLDLGISGSLPKGYIPSDMRRMDAYRRISVANDYDELEKVQHDIESAYGELPSAGRVLVELAELRISALKLDIVSIRRHERDVIFRTKRPELLEDCMSGARGTLRLVGQPDKAGATEVYYRPPPHYFEDFSLLRVLRARLRDGAGRGTPNSSDPAGDAAAGKPAHSTG